MSQHLELFRALSQPFDPGEVKSRTQGGKQLHYVTARTVMNRLDEVLGPENWWDDYQPGEHSVICRLSIRLPTGQLVTKCDAGGYAGMTDQGDDDKSGFSDAFKRAAVKFGVGRYLYRDGVARLEALAPTTPPKYKEWLEEYCGRVNRKWIADLPPESKKAPGEIVTTFQLNRHLLKALEIPPSSSEANNFKAGSGQWQTKHEAMEAEAKVYCRKLYEDARAKLSPHREPGSDDNMPSPDEEALLDRQAAKAVAS